jgi:hypothetical protein
LPGNVFLFLRQPLSCLHRLFSGLSENLLPAQSALSFLSHQTKTTMKQIITIIALLLLQTAIAQQPIHCTVNFTPMASELHGKATLLRTKDSFFLSSRPVPGIPFRFLKADSVITNGNSVKGQFRILSYTMRFSGIATADSVSLNLISTRTGNSLGWVRGGRTARPTTTYPVLLQQVLDSTEKLIFKKSYVETVEWERFKAAMKTRGAGVEDDIELMALFYMEARALPFTHFELVRKPEEYFFRSIADSKDDASTASLQWMANNTAVLRIADFNGDGSRIDSLMKEVLKKGAANLVIDLRGNGGGGAGAAMELMKYLSSNPQPAGAVVTRQWFNQHDAPPTADQYKQLISFSEGSTRTLIELIPKVPGFYLHIKPAKQTFKGNLFVLADGRTASTCEPIVYGLQYYKRATVVGAKTAGAVLSKIPVRLGNQYILMVPMADYFTIDGRRLDKNGVEPDVAVDSAKALDKVMELIAAGK